MGIFNASEITDSELGETSIGWDKCTIACVLNNEKAVKSAIKKMFPDTFDLDDEVQKLIIKLYQIEDYDICRAYRLVNNKAVVKSIFGYVMLIYKYMRFEEEALKKEEKVKEVNSSDISKLEDKDFIENIPYKGNEINKVGVNYIDELREICNKYEINRYISGLDIYALYESNLIIRVESLKQHVEIKEDFDKSLNIIIRPANNKIGYDISKRQKIMISEIKEAIDNAVDSGYIEEAIEILECRTGIKEKVVKAIKVYKEVNYKDAVGN